MLAEENPREDLRERERERGDHTDKLHRSLETGGTSSHSDHVCTQKPLKLKEQSYIREQQRVSQGHLSQDYPKGREQGEGNLPLSSKEG